MNELQEYLSKSKSKREKSIRKAAKVLKNVNNHTLALNVQDYEIEFPTLTPKRLQDFREQVNNQLHSFFNPQDKDLQKQRGRSMKFRTKKEFLKDVYLESLFTSRIRARMAPDLFKDRKNGLQGNTERHNIAGFKLPISLPEKRGQHVGYRVKSEVKQPNFQSISKL